MARLQDFPSVTPTSSDNILIVKSDGQGLASVGGTLGAKMDKANPTGTGSLSIGRSGTTGLQSVAVGYNVEASGARAVALGHGVTATADNGSFAEGYNTTASGVYGSHAEGRATTASGTNGSHAEGYETMASGSVSHAEGRATTASGSYSHSENINTVASGDRSHCEGYQTEATRRSQHVFGEYNIKDTSGADGTVKGAYIEIVGKGSNDANRSNARTLDWSGNEVLAGGLTINGADKVQAMVALEDMPKNTTKTYTIPSQIYNGGGIYLLAFNNLYHAGGVYILSVGSSSEGDKIKITALVSTSYLTVTAVAANQFSVTAGNSDFSPCLTRIA